MIKVEKINKKFIKQSKNKNKEEFYADKDISFEAKDNEVLGILGPNGAGKTTLLRMIAGIMTPSGGSITIDNLNYHDNEIEIKKRIAFLTGNTKLYKDLSAYELLTMCGNYYHMSKKDIKDRIEYLNKTFDMKSFLYQRIGTLSTGQTQRVSIARCLMHDPKYYILDEPTSGLDIISSKVILDTIKEEKDKGKCILYSTHYMEEVEHIADRILVIDKGKQIAGGTLKELLQSYENRVIYFLELDGLHKNGLNEFDFLNNINGIQKVQIYKEMLKVTAQKNISLSELFSALSTHGYTIKNMSSETGSLETVFLELTGRNLRD